MIEPTVNIITWRFFRHFSTYLYLFLFVSFPLVSCGRDSKTPPLYWGFALEGYPITTEQIKEVETDTGLAAQIILYYRQWPASPDSFDTSTKSLETIWGTGAIPCITWEPMYYLNNEEITIHYEAILNGTYDTYLKAFAKAIKTWGKPVIIRFAHEMNIDRYHWGTTQEAYGPESPRIYIEMFRYIVDLFRSQHADNVLWAFCPNADSVPNTWDDPKYSWNVAKNYYPGDNYVDLLGMDGYNCIPSKKTPDHEADCPFRSFEQIFQLLYHQLKDIAPQKPIIVFETASNDNQGSRLLWIIEAMRTIHEWRLQGIVWFQVNKEQDWRINSTGDNSYIPIIRSRISSESAQDWAKSLLPLSHRH